MKKILTTIKSNAVLSIILGVALGLFVLYFSKYLNNVIKENFLTDLELNFYKSNVVYKFLILIFSFAFILLFKENSIKEFGFRKWKKIRYGRFVFSSIGIMVASFIIGNIIFNGILRHMFPVEQISVGFPKSTIIQTIITIWIWSSFTEEVLTRGLVQGILDEHKNRKFLKLSLPVWISGLFFGLMHLSLIKSDMDIWFVSFIVFDATVLGILAAYYREKTNSIYPAIFLHVLSNIIGSLPAMIMGNI